MSKLYRHPLFLFGMAIRIALILSAAPLAVSTWYVPFLESSISAQTFNPWSTWLAAGGTPLAFPYGYVMWLILLPISFVSKQIGLPLHWGYDLTLLLVDFFLLITLNHLLPKHNKLILAAYWLSPIIILATYVLGLNDLIPTLLLTLSLAFIRQIKLRLAGICCAAAISAKFSMIVALPFFLIYIFNNKPLRQQINQFLIGLFICGVVFGLPFVLSDAGIRMLIGNRELVKVYHIALDLGGNVSIYLLPLVYVVMLYLTWRVRRLNFDLFQSTTGIAFLLIVLMTPASPGWFVWSIPFLILYQAMSGRIAVVWIGLFSALYVLSTLLVTPIVFVNGLIFNLSKDIYFSDQYGTHLASMLHTAMVAIGVILTLRIWRETISRNDFFRVTRKPFVIGVAGDSAAGKDTFVDAISGLLGGHSVVRLSGDDYHRWDRQKPMWQVMTHLNPMANDLEGFANDLISLADGKGIHARRYNHQTGKMSALTQVKSNDFIIANGLHALYLPLLRDRYHLKIYLDMDEALRRYYKIKRDVHSRGYTVEQVINSFKQREVDSERFIKPQAVYADLTLSLQPIHPNALEHPLDQQEPRLKLIVKTRQGLNELSLHRVLIGICGLSVDILTMGSDEKLQITIEGDVSAADIQMAAQILCPGVMEFLDIPPRWEVGMLGLMQLVALSHISHVLTKRFI